MKNRMSAGTFLAAALALVFLGCSSASSNAPQQNPTTGQHPAGWVQDHWVQYVTNPTSCVACHGSTSDPAAAGGIAQVSCFSCHPNGPGHPTGWADHMQHGRIGAQAALNATPFSMQGMASCTVCHGADFATGVGTTTSCYTCHTKAPHPNAPWGAGNPPVDPTVNSSHDQTDPSNAPECYTCHQAGSAINQALGIVTPTPAGASPGCYNNTMCHGKSF